MTVFAVADRDFIGLTIRDDRGASLVVERTADGQVSAWIAPPGGNDGPSVTVNDADRQQLAAFLTADKPGHGHTCQQVDRLQDEVRDLGRSVLVYATEDMRRTPIEAAGRGVVAALRLPGNNPDVDADLALKESIERLVTAVDDAEDPHLTPKALTGRLRRAIADPKTVVPRVLDGEGGPAESLTDWKLRAVLHLLTHGVKAVND